MPKINVYLPDDLADAVRDAGVPVSAICQRALEQAVRRISAIRQTVLDALSDADETATGPGLRFSVPAANAVELAVGEATAFGHNYVGCEHLLIGLAAEPDGVAGRVLRAAGADPKGVRRAVSAA